MTNLTEKIQCQFREFILGIDVFPAAPPPPPAQAGTQKREQRGKKQRINLKHDNVYEFDQVFSISVLVVRSCRGHQTRGGRFYPARNMGSVRGGRFYPAKQGVSTGRKILSFYPAKHGVGNGEEDSILQATWGR